MGFLRDYFQQAFGRSSSYEEKNEQGVLRRYLDGKLPAVGQPAVEYPDGTQAWMEHDKFHRLGAPAYITGDGSYQSWHENGQNHRLDGPAVVRADGLDEWWIRGVRFNNAAAHQAEIRRMADEKFLNGADTPTTLRIPSLSAFFKKR